MRVYHGSNVPVPKPEVEKGRNNADFGKGFYITESYEMAEKWASRKNPAVISEYELDIENLQTHTFELDAEWLNFVVSHRSETPFDLNINEYDALIGPTADDKMFSTIEQYENGLIPQNIAIKALNSMKIGIQINMRTQSGIDKHLHYIGSKTLDENRKKQVHLQTKKEHKIANDYTEKIIKESFSTNFQINDDEKINTNRFSNNYTNGFLQTHNISEETNEPTNKYN